MKKILESKAVIRFQDCDPFNHLNNAGYINYFINAREDQVKQHYNLDIFEHIKTTGNGWVVTSNQITYLKPALLMEEVVIESQLIKYTDNILQVEMKMWNKEKTVLKAVFWTSFAYLDLRTQQRTTYSEELMELFQNVVNPVEESIFEKRCFAILQTIKKSKLEPHAG